MMGRRVPYSEAGGKLEGACRSCRSAIHERCGFHCGKGCIRIVRPEWIRKPADYSARRAFYYLPVADELVILILHGHSFKMRMGIRMAGDLVTRVKVFQLRRLYSRSVCLYQRRGNEVEGAFHIIFIEQSDETSVRGAAVVITEGCGITLAAHVSVIFYHKKTSFRTHDFTNTFYSNCVTFSSVLKNIRKNFDLPRYCVI